MLVYCFQSAQMYSGRWKEFIASPGVYLLLETVKLMVEFDIFGIFALAQSVRSEWDYCEFADWFSIFVLTSYTVDSGGGEDWSGVT